MTLHGILTTATTHEKCTVCGCAAGKPCNCGGTHLCRIALAAHDQHITLADLASVIPDRDQSGRAVVMEVAA